MTVFFTLGSQNIMKNTTCDWSLTGINPNRYLMDGASVGSAHWEDYTVVQVLMIRLEHSTFDK